MKCPFFASLIAWVVAAATSSLMAESPDLKAPWPNWRGPNHDGVSNETGWAAAFPEGKARIAWQASVGTGFSSFAVAGGRAYTMGNVADTDVVTCLAVADEKSLWQFRYPQPLDSGNYEGGPHATPTVDGDRVYTFSKHGRAYCLKAATGDKIWEADVIKQFDAKKPTWGFAGSPLVLGDLVILNACSHGIALNKTTGELVWKSASSPGGYATAVPFRAGDTQAVMLFGQEALLAVRVSDGDLLWQFPWKTSYDVNAADPIVSDGKVFISSGYNVGCALLDISGAAPKVVWQNRNMRNHFNSCVLLGGHVYGFDEGTLKCLELSSGQEKWNQHGLGKGSLMVADGKLLVLSEDGRLVIAAASPDGFREQASAQILRDRCWTVPVLAGGRVYARNAAGNVVCLDVSKQ